MKTIKYNGKRYTVPDWVNYVATDYNGDTYAYEEEPQLNVSCGMWLARVESKAWCLHKSEETWKNSMKRVESV